MAIPLFHVYGMVAGMCYAVNTASSMVMIPNPRDLKDVLDSIQKFEASIYPGVPAMYNAINNNPDVLAGKYDLSTITACISGSAPLMRETKEKFEELTGGKAGGGLRFIGDRQLPHIVTLSMGRIHRVQLGCHFLTPTPALSVWKTR